MKERNKDRDRKVDREMERWIEDAEESERGNGKMDRKMGA